MASSDAQHDPDDGAEEEGGDPMFVIKNLDTGLEMRIDDFDRLANIATDEPPEHDPIHPKGKGGLIKGSKVFKNWGAAAAKTAKKAVTGIKDLSHELHVQQMLAKHKSSHSLEASPRLRQALSVDGDPASPGAAAAAAAAAYAAHPEQLLRMSQSPEPSVSLDDDAPAAALSISLPPHSDPSVSSEACSSRQASQAAAAGSSEAAAAAAAAAAGMQASPPGAGVAPPASARAAAAAGAAAAAAAAAAVAPPVPAVVRLVSHRRSAKQIEEVVLAQVLDVTGVVWALAFSRDGSFLAAAGQDGLLRVWQMTASRDREPRTNWVYDAQPATAAAAAAAAAEPAAQSNGNAADIQQQQQQQQQPLEGCPGSSSHLSSELQEQPAEPEQQQQQQEQQPQQQQQQPPRKPPPPVVEFGSYLSKQPVRVYAGHSEDVLDLSWSGSRFLLTASLDKSVRLWHLSQPGCLREFAHSDFVTSVAFHPLDAQRFVSGSFDGRVRVWSIPGGAVLAGAQVHQDSVTAVAASAGGSRVMAGTRRGRVRFYELSGKKLEYVAQVDVRNQRGQHASGKKVTAISPVPGQPNLFLITTNDSRLRLLEGQNYATLLKFKGHKNAGTQARACLSADGTQVVCGSDDGWVYVWQRAAGGAAAAAAGPAAGGGGTGDKAGGGGRGGLVAAAADQLQALAGKNAVFQSFPALEQGVAVTAVACAPPSAFEAGRPSVLAAAAAAGGAGAGSSQQAGPGAGLGGDEAEAAPAARVRPAGGSGRLVRQLLVAGGFAGGIRVFELLAAA